MILFDEQKRDGDLPISLDSREVLPAKIKVVGVGGGGGNAVNRMIDAKLRGVEFIAANTDLQALTKCRAPAKLQLGKQITRGLGAGADPEIGRKAAIEDTDAILECLDGADMIFLACGLGGGTGTGAMPVIASLAARVGALTVAVVTKPFAFEGRRRMHLAENGLDELRESVDTVIAIPNERLLAFVDRGTSLSQAFLIADDVLRQGVQGISDLITIPGEVNADFADVRTIMSGMGMALMGSGVAKGDNRAIEAAQAAVSSPLLEETSIQGAQGVLINITGGSDLTLHEVAEAARAISDLVDPDANIISGLVLDESMNDSVKVTVIATGFREGIVALADESPFQGSFMQPRIDEEPAPSVWSHAEEEPIEPEPPQAPAPSAPAFERRALDQVELSGRSDAPGQTDDEEDDKVPFYRKLLAHNHEKDQGGFGPNWSSVDDYDIPTVLRKQMD